MLRGLRRGLHEEVRELAAQQLAGEIAQADADRVKAHLEECRGCREAVAEFELLGDYGRALSKLTEVREPEWNHEQQKAMVFARLRSEQETQAFRPLKDMRSGALLRIAGWATATAVFVSGGVFLGYHAGKQEKAPVILASSAAQVMSAQLLQDDLSARLRDELSKAKDAAAHAERRVANLEASQAKLTDARAGLEERNKALQDEISQGTQSVQAAAREKDDIAGRLAQTEQQLKQVEQQLQDVRDQRNGDLLRVASADVELKQFSSELQEKENTIARQQQYLESDRDIRDLMGARHLYIADVTDVDKNGNNRRPFGRVFYTKGKSLVFYAFDLDQQPGVRNASVFEVWGHTDEAATRSVSLGIFYLDNTTNRRWVLKADDPQILAQLDSVFVTVEKNGKSKEPTGKPFLYTYLRKDRPNHS